MIFDNIKNIEKYNKLENIYEALLAIKNSNIANVNDNIKIKTEVLQTENSLDRVFENHKLHTDIHYCVKGTERIELIFDRNDIRVLKEYDLNTDIEFFENDTAKVVVVLQANDFVVIYPGELHKPCCSVQENNELEKYIVKIRNLSI